MSSYWAGNAGTGMALSHAEFMDLIKRYKALNPEEAEKVDQAIDNIEVGDLGLVPSYLAGLGAEDGNRSYLEPLYDDFASGAALWPFYKKDSTENTSHDKDGRRQEVAFTSLMPDGDPCYVCWSSKAMDSVRAFQEKPYASYQEFRAEFQDQFQKYLPADFDWDGHLGRITFASFG